VETSPVPTITRGGRAGFQRGECQIDENENVAQRPRWVGSEVGVRQICSKTSRCLQRHFVSGNSFFFTDVAVSDC
jgi:hypothetical protein